MKNIIWTEPAVNDLQSIFEYISSDSEYYARIFIGKIIQKAEEVIDFPQIGRVVPEYNEPNIREVFHQNYRIIYRIEPEAILILTVIHGRRDLSKSDKNEIS